MAKTLHLTVTGMTCGGCENAVKRALEQLKGVQKVEASHATNSVDVTYDDDADLATEVMKNKIATLGYQLQD